MKITDYAFGNMTVDGKSFNSDLIIYPDGRIQSSWWRKSGHVLASSDIAELIDSGPEVIVAGTGAYGIMKPETGLSELLSQNGIQFKAMPTAEAVKLFNELAGASKVGGCFHLTC